MAKTNLMINISYIQTSCLISCIYLKIWSCQAVCWCGWWWLWSPLTTRLYIVTIRTGVSDNSYVMSGCRSLWTAQVLISSCRRSADMGGGGYEALSLPGLYIVTIRTGVSDNKYVMSGCRSLWTAQALISSCSLSADMGGGYEALSLPGYI